MEAEALLCPNKLVFGVALGTQAKTALILTNPTLMALAFKVRTTNPNAHSVKPCQGIIQPGATQHVAIARAAAKSLPAVGEKCKDKFQVAAVALPPGITEVSSQLFKSGHVATTNVKVVLIPQHAASPLAAVPDLSPHLLPASFPVTAPAQAPGVAASTPSVVQAIASALPARTPPAAMAAAVPGCAVASKGGSEGPPMELQPSMRNGSRETAAAAAGPAGAQLAADGPGEPGFDGEQYVGRRVVKSFGGKLFAGEVVSFKADVEWFLIRYEDSDEEDIDWDELQTILQPLKGPDASGSVRSILDGGGAANTSGPAAKGSARGSAATVAASEPDSNGAAAASEPGQAAVAAPKAITERAASGGHSAKLDSVGATGGVAAASETGTVPLGRADPGLQPATSAGDSKGGAAATNRKRARQFPHIKASEKCGECKNCLNPSWHKPCIVARQRLEGSSAGTPRAASPAPGPDPPPSSPGSSRPGGQHVPAPEQRNISNITAPSTAAEPADLGAALAARAAPAMPSAPEVPEVTPVGGLRPSGSVAFASEGPTTGVPTGLTAIATHQPNLVTPAAAGEEEGGDKMEVDEPHDAEQEQQQRGVRENRLSVLLVGDQHATSPAKPKPGGLRARMAGRRAAPSAAASAAPKPSASKPRKRGALGGNSDSDEDYVPEEEELERAERNADAEAAKMEAEGGWSGASDGELEQNQGRKGAQRELQMRQQQGQQQQQEVKIRVKQEAPQGCCSLSQPSPAGAAGAMGLLADSQVIDLVSDDDEEPQAKGKGEGEGGAAGRAAPLASKLAPGKARGKHAVAAAAEKEVGVEDSDGEEEEEEVGVEESEGEEEEEEEDSSEPCPNCGCLFRRGDFWIQCDSCDRWFDGKCVGMTEKKAAKTREWSCPLCQSGSHEGLKEKLEAEEESEDEQPLSKHAASARVGGSNSGGGRMLVSWKTKMSAGKRRRGAGSGAEEEEGDLGLRAGGQAVTSQLGLRTKSQVQRQQHKLDLSVQSTAGEELMRLTVKPHTSVDRILAAVSQAVGAEVLGEAENIQAAPPAAGAAAEALVLQLGGLRLKAGQTVRGLGLRSGDVLTVSA